jgi:hypothetical protein
MQLVVPNGVALLDVFGVPRFAGEWLFVPAAFDYFPARAGAKTDEAETPTPEGFEPLFGDAGDPDGKAHWPPALARLRRELDRSGDADSWFLTLWTRARLPVLFGVEPPGGRDLAYGPLFEVSFAAVTDPEDDCTLRVIPFVCTSGLHERLGLEFDPGVEPAVRRRVTEAFRGLLLKSPEDICRFRHHYQMEEALGVVGLDAQGFYEEAGEGWDWEDGPPPQEHDPHWSVVTGETWPCPECGGSGEESFFPAGAPCEVCAGSGRVVSVEEYDPRSRRKQRAS